MSIYPHMPLYCQQWPDGTELCDQCGQPDNCGDCNHKPLTETEIQELGGTIVPLRKEVMQTAIFNPGKVGVTATLVAEIERQGMNPTALVPYLDRHCSGDWGEIDKHDHRVNADALKTGARIMSAYDLPSVGRIWIITDAAWTEDVRTRQITTVMFPSDY